MEPHCAIGKDKNLLVYMYNKFHQSNLNSFLFTEFFPLGQTQQECLG